jgi:hypothetical protein
MSVRETFIGKISLDPEKSELMVGEELFSYHCDKFNTRILKGFEDTLGFDKARDLLFTSSESTNYDALKGMFDLIEGETPQDKLKSIFEMFKVLGHGDLYVKDINAKGGTITAKKSYMVEGWLENQERWHWSKRTKPICHDESGAIAAAFEIANGLDKGSVTVNETECSVTGASECVFNVEVK